MKKVTFIEKVLAFLKGDDAIIKVERFHKRIVKNLVNSNKVNKDELETLEEKLIDAKEALETTIAEVDVTRLNNSESIDAYAVEYIAGIVKAQDKIAKLEDSIAAAKEAIAVVDNMSVIFE
jgi:hypothetical protein